MKLNNIQSKSTPAQKAYFSESFVPSNDDIVCGKGKQYYLHTGNQKFRLTIQINLQSYLAAKSKVGKSVVVNNILETFRLKTNGGRFVRQDTKNGRWFEIGDDAAREKIGQCIREAALRCDPEKLKEKRRRRAEQKARRLQRAQNIVQQAEQTFKQESSTNVQQEKQKEGQQQSNDSLYKQLELAVLQSYSKCGPTPMPSTLLAAEKHKHNKQEKQNFHISSKWGAKDLVSSVPETAFSLMDEMLASIPTELERSGASKSWFADEMREMVHSDETNWTDEEEDLLSLAAAIAV